MDNGPLVSVGIPCYNRPEGLRRTLECICGQTYRNLEIIISDNCSPDPDVERVAREFACKDSRIQYFRQSVNNGPMFNFKFVLEKATGEYFMWASDDDEWESEFISSLMTSMRSEDSVSFAFCNIVNIDLNDNLIRDYPSFLRFHKKSKFITISKIFLEPEILGKANIIYSIFYRNLLIDIVNSGCMDNEYWGSDCAFVLGAFARGDFACVNKVLMKKRVPIPAETDKKPKKIQINSPYKYSVPLSKFIGYTKNCLLATRNTRCQIIFIFCIPVKLIISIYGYLYEKLFITIVPGLKKRFFIRA